MEWKALAYREGHEEAARAQGISLSKYAKAHWLCARTFIRTERLMKGETASAGNKVAALLRSTDAAVSPFAAMQDSVVVLAQEWFLVMCETLRSRAVRLADGDTDGGNAVEQTTALVIGRRRSGSPALPPHVKSCAGELTRKTAFIALRHYGAMSRAMTESQSPLVAIHTDGITRKGQLRTAGKTTPSAAEQFYCLTA